MEPGRTKRLGGTMKRRMMVLFWVAAVSSLLFAQSSLLLKVGGAYSLDINKVGFLTGLELGRNFDEMINVNVGGGFQKYGESETKNSDSIWDGSTWKYKREVTRNDEHWVFPIKTGLRIRLPIGGSILPVINGGIGYVFYNHNTNAVDSSNKSVTLKTDGLYQGFYWESGLGFDWKLGSKSSLVGDIAYQGSEPTNKNDWVLNLRAVQFHIGILLEY
jgi:hypothetical protein